MVNLLIRALAPVEIYAKRTVSNAQWQRGEAGVGPSGRMLDVPKAPGELAISSRLLSPSAFELGDLLGEGNYSAVYHATLKATQAEFALKAVDKSKCRRYKKQDEVVVEKWVLAHLSHPSMVRIFHTFQDHASLYLALEFVPGGELWAGWWKGPYALSEYSAAPGAQAAPMHPGAPPY